MFFTYFYTRLFLLWRREKDFNAEKLGFSFHFCARRLITKVRELINFPSAAWLRLLRLFIFAQNSLLVPRARTTSLGRRTYSGGPRKCEQNMSRVWKLDGNGRQVTPSVCVCGTISLIRFGCAGVAPRRNTAESGRENWNARCMCSRFNPHTKDRANRDKKQSRSISSEIWGFWSHERPSAWTGAMER